MVGLRHVSTFLGADAKYLKNITDLEVLRISGKDVLVSATWLGGGHAVLDLAGPDDAPVLLGTIDYPSSFSHHRDPGVVALDIGGTQAVFATNLGNDGRALILDSGGAPLSWQPLLNSSVVGASLIDVGQFDTPQGDFLFASTADKLGFDIYKIGAGGGLTHITTPTVPYEAQLPGATLDALKMVETQGNWLLLGLSGQGNFLSLSRLSAEGQIIRNDFIGVGAGTGFNRPNAIEVVEVNGVAYAIASSASASSLTVLRLEPGGGFAVVDHVIDEMTTRFQHCTALATAEVNGRVYVFAGGNDDGITVFLMQPDGRLLFQEAVADSGATTLNNVSDITTRVVSGQIELFVSSATETGITKFALDPGNIGQTRQVEAGDVTGSAQDDLLIASDDTTWLRGGDGNDTLIGNQTLTRFVGGAGADVFVPHVMDGMTFIYDYQPGEDRLDLSQLGYLRSTYQLTIITKSWGAILRWADLSINIYTAGGHPLEASHFTNEMFPNAHYALPQEKTVVTGGETADLLRAVKVGSTLYGLGGHDRLFGDVGADTLDGGDGDDVLLGDAGADLLLGGEGKDTLRGGLDGDRAEGGGGDDLLLGDEGADSLFGGAGNDRLFAGDDDDSVDGGDGADRLWLGAGNDTAEGGAGDDWLSGDDGDDVLTDLLGTNTLLGGAGSDLLRGGAGDDWLQGDGGNDTIEAGTGADHILGGDGDDVIAAGDGDDSVSGGAGHDSILAGAGDDRASGDQGDDTIRGGDGADDLRAGAGNDLLHGDEGADSLNGGSGDDTVTGGAGDDLIGDSDGADRIDGGDGDDMITDQGGASILIGGAGNDMLTAGSGDDRVDGGTGSDRIEGGAGHDSLMGGAGADTIAGGDGNDRIDGGDDADLLAGQAGNDLIDGAGGDDRLSGGTDQDTLIGGTGDDALDGGGGDDLLRGDDGFDWLLGGDGADSMQGGTNADRLEGGIGNDRIEGGAGADFLIGGAGADLFVYGAARDSDLVDGADWIADFTSGSDRIDLTALDLTFIGQAAFSAIRQLRFEDDGHGNTRLLADMDGDGGADFQVTLQGAHSLAAGDFLL